MPNENEIIVNNEGSNDLSQINLNLEELINIISNELEEKKKKEEEQLKKEEELLKEQEQLEQEQLKEKENNLVAYQELLENTSTLESINTLMQEQVFLNKLSFVGLGVGIALVSVMIFQNSFKR